MGQPTPTDVHVDRPLTNISLAYIQDQSNFIAPQVFPVIPVDKQTDKYYIYTQDDWFRDEMQVRPPATESAGSGWTLSTTSYSCDVFALHKDLDDQTLRNADVPLNLMREAVTYLTQKALLKMENQWVTDYFTTSVWDDDVVGGTDFTQWSNYGSSDPIQDIELGKETILGNTGFEPNTLVMGYQVFRYLKHHPDLGDKIKYSGEGFVGGVGERMLAQMFDVERVLVAKSIKATNQEGATAAYSFNLGKNALLCYVAPSPGLMTASAGYTFEWNSIDDGMGITTIPMRKLRAQRMEIQKSWDNKVVATNLGYFFSGAVA